MLRHRVAMLVVFAVVLAATVEMYSVVPKGFIPDQDNDQMNINIRAAQGTSFYEMAAAGQRVGEVIRQKPYIESFMVRVGGGGGYGQSNQAQAQVNLVPRRQRPLSAQQISQQLRRQTPEFSELQRVREPALVAADWRRASAAARTTSPSRAPTPTSCTWTPGGWPRR